MWLVDKGDRRSYPIRMLQCLKVQKVKGSWIVRVWKTKSDGAALSLCCETVLCAKKSSTLWCLRQIFHSPKRLLASSGVFGLMDVSAGGNLQLWMVILEPVDGQLLDLASSYWWACWAWQVICQEKLSKTYFWEVILPIRNLHKTSSWRDWWVIPFIHEW